jgi:hypothetical protein
MAVSYLSFSRFKYKNGFKVNILEINFLKLVLIFEEKVWMKQQFT